MSINFEAAHMAGYNNPRVYMLRVSINATGTKVLEAPSYATIGNIVKSGFLPVLYVTRPTGDAVIAPLTATDNMGDYFFNSIFPLSLPTAPAILSLTYLSGAENPAVNVITLSTN